MSLTVIGESGAERPAAVTDDFLHAVNYTIKDVNKPKADVLSRVTHHFLEFMFTKKIILTSYNGKDKVFRLWWPLRVEIKHILIRAHSLKPRDSDPDMQGDKPAIAEGVATDTSFAMMDGQLPSMVKARTDC